MWHKPSKQLSIILVFIFVAAALFFAITKQVATDVAEAQAEKKALALRNRTVATVSSEPTTQAVPEVKTPPQSLEPNPTFARYLEVTDSCGVRFGGECLRVRSGPGTDFPVVASLRNGMVLKVSGTITTGTSTWHKVVFDEWLRYPERHNGDWYVAGAYVNIIKDEGTKTLETHPRTSTTSKSILVDRSDQKVYAYDGDKLFLTATTSTGLDSSPTPRGVFTIFKKTPSRYMQGPLPNISNDYYDLPGVPWTMYFTDGGAAIHGAYWHDKFGTKHSHGCVNLEPAIARTLYNWAELGTTVTVRD